jgi:3-oxoacyl-[acyl-carrier-protein] synthase-3
VAGCPAFDVNAACSGFVFALGVADKFIRSGDCKHVLVIGTETLTRMVDWNDRTTCVLFGDGAGAVVLKADEETGILSTHLHADGSRRSCCGTRWACRPASRTAPTVAAPST